MEMEQFGQILIGIIVIAFLFFIIGLGISFCKNDMDGVKWNAKTGKFKD